MTQRVHNLRVIRGDAPNPEPMPIDMYQLEDIVAHYKFWWDNESLSGKIQEVRDRALKLQSELETATYVKRATIRSVLTVLMLIHESLKDNPEENHDLEPLLVELCDVLFMYWHRYPGDITVLQVLGTRAPHQCAEQLIAVLPASFLPRLLEHLSCYV